MKIVLLTETFPRNMGYMVTMLPRYLARLGAEVHVVTTDLSAYWHIADFKETYSGFAENKEKMLGTIEQYDGYTLHTMPHRRTLGYMRIMGLREKLFEIRPDITYAVASIGWIALEAALWKMFLGYKLFTGNHTTASVFPLAQRTQFKLDWPVIKSFLTRAVLGRLTSLVTTKCYGATKDCADVAVRFFGVQANKIDVCPLGVDTELFTPPLSESDLDNREKFRNELGFGVDEIVCIYTGRFTEDKNPLVLAEAVARLVAQGEPYRAIFVGHGVQADALSRLPGCTVLPFTPVENLPRYYRSADIGVWPTQESTSMLDATACGLPLIVNDTLIATERIDGNGLTYRLNDVDDMVRILLMLKDPSLRKKMGEFGAHKMATEFSWSSLARRRFNDFEAELNSAQ